MPTPVMPLWLATIVVTLTLIALTEIAFRVTRAILGKRPDRDAKAEGDGSGLMLSAALALLGLLIGFTFAMASDRYDARRGWVNEEANALGTAYLRSRLAIGPDRAVLPTLWSNYAETRYAIVLGHKTPREQRTLLARGNEIQTLIWRATQRETATARDDVTAALIDATNTAFDVAGSRQTAAEARIPASIIWGVLAYAAVACAILGHVLATDRRRLLMSSVLTGLVSLSIAMIIDLDQPQTGAIRVSQAPMERVVRSIRAWQVADTAAPPVAPPCWNATERAGFLHDRRISWTPSAPPTPPPRTTASR